MINTTRRSAIFDKPDIKSRKFDWGQGGNCDQPRWWLNDDPVATAVYNGLSLNFPRAEVFFIESVRVYRGSVSENLVSEIQAFTKQEVMHTHGHALLNRQIVAAGYDVGRIEERIDNVLHEARATPAVVKLASTMILEHITAIGSKQILVNDRHMAGADHNIAALWRWHSTEEIEHKGVAYDVWLQATKDWSYWKRWKIRSVMTLVVTFGFCKQRWIDTLDLLRQDGLSGLKIWLRLFWFLVGKPGMIRKLLLPWLRLFLPSFHPWNNDDRSLIQLSDSKYQNAILHDGVKSESG